MKTISAGALKHNLVTRGRLAGENLCAEGATADVARGAEAASFAQVVGACDEPSAVGKGGVRGGGGQCDEREAAGGIDGEDTSDEGARSRLECVGDGRRYLGGPVIAAGAGGGGRRGDVGASAQK